MLIIFTNIWALSISKSRSLLYCNKQPSEVVFPICCGAKLQHAFKLQFGHLLVLWSWMSVFTSMCLMFSLWKMGMLIRPIVLRIKWSDISKVLNTVFTLLFYYKEIRVPCWLKFEVGNEGVAASQRPYLPLIHILIIQWWRFLPCYEWLLKNNKAKCPKR